MNKDIVESEPNVIDSDRKDNPILAQNTCVNMVHKEDYKRKENRLKSLELPQKDMDVSMPESSIRLDQSTAQLITAQRFLSDAPPQEIEMEPIR